eukprot:COSAG01_NODE_24191_length_787_cov_1.161337_1_plen_59_part_00
MMRSSRSSNSSRRRRTMVIELPLSDADAVVRSGVCPWATCTAALRTAASSENVVYADR